MYGAKLRTICSKTCNSSRFVINIAISPGLANIYGPVSCQAVVERGRLLSSRLDRACLGVVAGQAESARRARLGQQDADSLRRGSLLDWRGFGTHNTYNTKAVSGGGGRRRCRPRLWVI